MGSNHTALQEWALHWLYLMMALIEGKTGQEVLKLLEIELHKFENLCQEISERNRKILTEKRRCSFSVTQFHHDLIINREKPKIPPKPPIRVRAMTLPKPILPKRPPVIVYEDSELGSEV